MPGLNHALRGVVYVKLGGSFITVKEKPVTLRKDALDAVAAVLKQVHGEVGLILGNGGGSFAHYAVKKYCVNDPVQCVVKCHQSTRLLNRMVVDHLVALGVPASSLQTSAIVSASPGGGYRVFPDPVYNYLSLGLIPVVYGECIPSERGYSVVSTEKVFELLAESIKPLRIVLVTDVKGVYTCNPYTCENPELIRRINSGNMEEVLELLSREEGRDATGSIYGKVKSMSALSRRIGVKVIIVSGFDQKGLADAIVKGEVEEGTVIEP
ncbi:isopentenyl phosphate kinase [Desulfurococcus mucosus]|uniref:Isopentenyl phosphate kinase n=1 Tax=Desulfurococcus mucosus (strain ATCC 35584 / DSM 2162 / JCM 9187 / O7/1) TaxID=765177 RepID=E8RA18_DESM0|nr:isopentenyl phosphate kinase [Desulfurococcus mucosus]ADV65344.1 isopentenyl phosphate kinase [Desulfurococcus mucosus DSM 2162]